MLQQTLMYGAEYLKRYTNQYSNRDAQVYIYSGRFHNIRRRTFFKGNNSVKHLWQVLYRDHPFKTYKNFSGKLTALNTQYALVRVRVKG